MKDIKSYNTIIELKIIHDADNPSNEGTRYVFVGDGIIQCLRTALTLFKDMILDYVKMYEVFPNISFSYVPSRLELEDCKALQDKESGV